MKNLLLFFILFVTSTLIFAQESIKYDYCEIVGTSRLLSTKVTVEIDFGQKTKFFSDKRYKDESGKPVVFNSMIDAMNFMGNQGWDFAQAYAVTVGNSTMVYHYVLKKKTNENSDAEKK